MAYFLNIKRRVHKYIFPLYRCLGKFNFNVIVKTLLIFRPLEIYASNYLEILED